MTQAKAVVVDGNEAAASVAYRASEVIAIYPITPASPMGELSDEWAAHGRENLWGQVPSVAEMQSEGGAAGAVHGALSAGALTTTFTASQGLLLMVPNLFKIAGELTPFCIHVAARSIATHALSIFGDHSDVMACRGTGFAMLASADPQQAHDMAAIAHAATLKTRVPFMHFFDGFRTSHELAPVELLDDDALRSLLDGDAIRAVRGRALSPDHPVIRGTAQNPDTFFQAREACNPFYDACPDAVVATMARFGELTGRHYQPFDYFGHPEAERVLVMMGSGTETMRETVEYLAKRGERVGGVAVRLYRPFDGARLLSTLPATARAIAVLDRTKEPGAPGEPLFLDVMATLAEAGHPALPRTIGGRYGLSSKELTPTMLGAALAELKNEAPKRRFTLGIIDDVTHTSLKTGQPIDVLPDDVYQAVFFGLGADGTVGANKNTIKILGEHSDKVPYGYFVYDSKKSGAVTVSHLRFAERKLGAPYLIEAADLVACHQFELLDRMDVVGRAKPGATLLLNAPYAPDQVFDKLSLEVQTQILDKGLSFHAIDAYSVARDAGLRGRINTVMQVCFFAIAKLLPIEEAIDHIKTALQKSYGKKGGEVVRRNLTAVDAALAGLHKIELPAAPTTQRHKDPVVPGIAPEFVQRVTARIMAGEGDLLPVSAFPPDGTWPSATSQWDKRNIAVEIPVWDADICIQCNKCTLICPHAAIRAKVFEPEALAGAPEGFTAVPFKSAELKGKQYTLQVAPEDCTGCNLCAVVCPAKDKSNPRHKALDMHPQRPLREVEAKKFAFFLELPEADRSQMRMDVKHTQLLQPLFEFSGACSGCGETPYIKLLTQLFGDRLLVANATGCSSIYGGNLPTTPYTVNADGRGPAWSNSLFEDNAEFGLGFKLAVDALQGQAKQLCGALAGDVDASLVEELLSAAQQSEADIAAQRARVLRLRPMLEGRDDALAKRLLLLCDYLVDKSVWLVGGDGWAYDIGFGGLDHVLASGKNVNILVLDTEVYSNTGGQQSKATPMAASAKFAAAGKALAKKDLGLIAMSYDHVYVAQVALGARDKQTLDAFVEAERHPGPSLIIAYSHCIAHGYDMMNGATQQKLAVESGVWPLYRFDPARAERGGPPLHLDSGPIKRPASDYMRNEARFRVVERMDPKRFERLQADAQAHTARRIEHYKQLAQLRVTTPENKE